MYLFVSRLDKGLLEATSNHLGPSWAQSGIKMAQHGSRLFQEGFLGSRHMQNVNIPTFLNDFQCQSKATLGLCWGYFGPKYSFSAGFLNIFKSQCWATYVA